MALYGVLGDIHGNREALEAVLGALDARGVRQILCVGDIVGYNADPDECAALLRGRRVAAIVGNHDLIGTGRLDFRRCSNKARYSLKRTRRVLRRETVEWLATLPPHRVVEDRDVVLVHGGVRDVQQYMRRPEHIRDNAALLRYDFPGAKLCFFGHSHEQRVYRVDGEGVVQALPPSQGTTLLDKRQLHFVNPGSVDAQRKHADRRAECALFDSLEWSIEFLRLRYDATATEVKAAAFGYRIPPWTDRLYTLRTRLRGLLSRASAR
jgi:predicted phosphodiesterase